MICAIRCLILVLFAWALSACSVAPTHTSLADAQLPQLLPVRAFVANTDYNESYRVSPDGSKLAWRGVSQLRPAILWRHVDGEQVFALRFKKQAPNPHWAADGHTILYHDDPSGRENDHVYAIDTRDAQPEPHDLTPYPDVKAFVAHVPLTQSGTVFVMHNRRDPSTLR